MANDHQHDELDIEMPAEWWDGEEDHNSLQRLARRQKSDLDALNALLGAGASHSELAEAAQKLQEQHPIGFRAFACIPGLK